MLGGQEKPLYTTGLQSKEPSLRSGNCHAGRRVALCEVFSSQSVSYSRLSRPWRNRLGNGQAVAIGPWLIEATYRNGKFERCGMSRTTEEGIEARLTRAGGGLTLAMTSPRWRLEQRKSYPIELAAGTVTWETKVTATINTVQVALTEPRFNEGLRLADILEIRGAGSVIRVPLDKSAAAMERLERCYENNSRSIETNPFVAPSRRP